MFAPARGGIGSRAEVVNERVRFSLYSFIFSRAGGAARTTFPAPFARANCA